MILNMCGRIVLQDAYEKGGAEGLLSAPEENHAALVRPEISNVQ